MYSLREGLEHCFTDIRQQVAHEVVKRVKKTSETITKDMQQSYDEFFEHLSEDIVGSEINMDEGGTPPFLGAQGEHWAALSEKGAPHNWAGMKQRAADAGYPDAITLYRGITEAMASGMNSSRRLKGRKTKFRKLKKPKGKSRTSFKQYLDSLAAGGRQTVEKFFGPLTVDYTITRPDGGKVKVLNPDDLKPIIQHHEPHTGRFTKLVPNVIITTSVSAFTTVPSTYTEYSFWEFMSKRAGGAGKGQWVKTSAGSGTFRPTVGPLISWYLKSEFVRAMQGAYK